MTESISYACYVNKKQTVCVCAHGDKLIQKTMIKSSNHDHCNKCSLNKKPRRFTWKPLRSTVTEGGHRCVDPNVQSSIQVSPSTLLKFSIHEDFSRSISSCANGPNALRIHRLDSKKPLKINVWDFCAQNHFYPLWYTVYLYHISDCFMHIQNLTSHGTSRKNNHKSNATTIYGHVSPQNDLLLRRLEKLSYCTSKMSMVQTCNLPW